MYAKFLDGVHLRLVYPAIQSANGARRNIDRAVDLATTPLYVRGGAVIPMGPIKQYVEEKVDEPLMLVIHPGADGSSSVYEDDGHSFDYRKGQFMRLAMIESGNKRAGGASVLASTS